MTKRIDHSKFIAMIMMKNAGPLIRHEDMGALYEGALTEYRRMLSVMDFNFEPPEGFREILIEQLQNGLPSFEVPR